MGLIPFKYQCWKTSNMKRRFDGFSSENSQKIGYVPNV